MSKEEMTNEDLIISQKLLDILLSSETNYYRIIKIKGILDQQNKELLEQLAEKENCIINLNNSRNGLICELAEKKKEWISVNHGLPNENIQCKVKVDCSHNGNGIIEPKHAVYKHAVYKHDLNQWESGLSTLYFVTHWMPLPNKPQ